MLKNILLAAAASIAVAATGTSIASAQNDAAVVRRRMI